MGVKRRGVNTYLVPQLERKTSRLLEAQLRQGPVASQLDTIEKSLQDARDIMTQKISVKDLETSVFEKLLKRFLFFPTAALPGTSVGMEQINGALVGAQSQSFAPHPLLLDIIRSEMERTVPADVSSKVKSLDAQCSSLEKQLNLRLDDDRLQTQLAVERRFENLRSVLLSQVTERVQAEVDGKMEEQRKVGGGRTRQNGGVAEGRGRIFLASQFAGWDPHWRRMLRDETKMISYPQLLEMIGVSVGWDFFFREG